MSTNLLVPATGKKYGVSLEVNDAQSVLTLKVSTTPAPAQKSDGAVVLDEPLTPATAPRRLLGELLTRTNEKLTGSGSTIGDPRIRAGTVIRLTELGVRIRRSLPCDVGDAHDRWQRIQDAVRGTQGNWTEWALGDRAESEACP